MSALALHLVPRRWRELSERSARLRLTLLYSGMFLGLGTLLIAIILIFVWHGDVIGSSSHAIAVAPSDTGGPVNDAVTQQHSADVARLLAVSWLTLAFTAAISAPLGWFAAGRMLRPLRQMTTAARTITAGNLHDRLAVAGPEDEFKQLGDSFDELLARLEAAFAAQRRFVANAAHELRTPLTLERTLLQVALADPDASVETLRATCEELLSAGRGQERLLEALLTLATSERGLEHRERLELNALTERALARAEPEIEGRHLDLRPALRPATLSGDQPLIERLIANLLDNAISHNHEGGWIAVETATESDRAVLRVANSGAVIYPDEVEPMFEPFHRRGSDRTKTDGHHGLGLSIARAIVRAHDGEIAAAAQPGGGLVVTVRLPATA
jgi:signal transduction histidine kinase